MSADITRRKALATVPALAAVVAMPSDAAEGGDDHKLLAAIAEFEPRFAEHERVWGMWCECAEKSRAAPDWPPSLATCPEDCPSMEEIDAHMERFGATHELYARANDLDTELRGRSDEIFAMPATTFDGILAKFRLARLLDTNLNDWDTWDAHDTWTEHVERDLRRLAGGAS